MTSPRTLLKAWNLHPKKHLGQNFLTDPSTAEAIVKNAGILPEDTVLEIGAGFGALTIPIAQIAKKVFAVEKDHNVINLLETELLAKNLANVVLMEKDILKVDIKTLAEDVDGKIVVIGNLPYNISSQILIRLILSRKIVSRAVLMFQKELAQRIMAQPGGRDYGRLTVMLRYCSDIKRIFSVKASLFFPKPKIDSDILEVRFRDLPKYPADDEDFLFKVIKAAFSKRRKTLKNALSSSELSIDKETVKNILDSVEIDPSRRAETLTVQEFVKLSNMLKRSYCEI